MIKHRSGKGQTPLGLSQSFTGTHIGRKVAMLVMNLDVPIVKRNGLPLWHGAQLAVDANLVSPVATAPRAAAMLPSASRRGKGRLVVLGLEVGGC